MSDTIGDGIEPYQPFGEDWRKEMMKFSKRRLIECIRAKWQDDKEAWPVRMLELDNENEVLRKRIAELEDALTPEEIESILDGNAKFLDKRHAECDKIEAESEVLRKRIAELETALWRCEHERISKL